MEDIGNGENRYFYSPVTEKVAHALKNPSKVVIYDFIKKFIERVSCGMVHIDVSCIIIDALLTKRYRQRNDPILI